jgi:DNA-binding GntR family transcriptional regulator
VTIRGVLRSLADIGLLQIISHGGAFFSSSTPPKAWEIFSIGALMESYATRLAVSVGPLADDVMIERENALERTNNPADRDKPIDLIKTVFQFHLIAQQGGRELLLTQLEKHQAQIRQLIFKTNPYQSDPVSEVESNQRVLEAIRSGDGALAEHAILAHHSASGKRLAQRMSALDLRRRAETTADGRVITA